MALIRDKYVSQEGQDLIPRLPVRRFEYVDVVFPTANTDVTIKHKLVPIDKENISWSTVRLDRAAIIYKDYSLTRKPWADGYIVLRANISGTQARLLLFLEETPNSE